MFISGVVAIFSVSRIVDPTVYQKQILETEQNVVEDDEESQQERSDTNADGTEGDLENDACDCGHLGDMNNDNKIDSFDAQLIINMVLNRDPKGDLNGDDKINSGDIQLVINTILDGVTCPCQVYRNEKYGYTIRVPQELEVDASMESLVLFSSDFFSETGYTLGIYVFDNYNPERLPIDEWHGNNPEIPFPSLKDRILRITTCWETIVCLKDDLRGHVLFTHGTDIYFIQNGTVVKGSLEPGDRELFEQLLSGFQL